MAFAVYEQSTGLFAIFEFDDGGNERCLGEYRGYAGRGLHKNNPASDHVRNLGPLPRGFYRVGDCFDHSRLGVLAYRLEPFAVNEMHGRSGFLIHGDSRLAPGDASRGCIILHRAGREAILRFQVKQIEVVPGPVGSKPSAFERSEKVGTTDR